MVGCIAAVSYGGRFGFIGLYIVVAGIPRARRRPQALGCRHGAPGRPRVGLDGVPAQQSYYRRNGFRLAWQNARFVGPARPLGAPEAGRDRSARRCRFPRDLRRRRARVSGAARGLPALLDPHARCVAGLAWIEQGRLIGWGLVRRCREGHKIGPLVADRPAAADAPVPGAGRPAAGSAMRCSSTCPCPTRRRWRWRRPIACSACSRPRGCTPAASPASNSTGSTASPVSSWAEGVARQRKGRPEGGLARHRRQAYFLSPPGTLPSTPLT